MSDEEEDEEEVVEKKAEENYVRISFSFHITFVFFRCTCFFFVVR
jgi:hypothetical protein